MITAIENPAMLMETHMLDAGNVRSPVDVKRIFYIRSKCTWLYAEPGFHPIFDI